MSYSLSSFSVPLALQAVVCFLALMCFFFHKKQRIKKKIETKRHEWLKYKACTCMCVVVWCANVSLCVCLHAYRKVYVCVRALALNLLGSRCSNYRTALLPNDRKCCTLTYWLNVCETETWMKFLSLTSWTPISPLNSPLSSRKPCKFLCSVDHVHCWRLR